MGRRSLWPYSVRRLIIFCVFLFIAGLVIGVLAGYFGRVIPPPSGVVLDGVSDRIISDADPRISDLLLHETKAENIRQNLINYASYPHLAGTSADLKQAEQVKKQWLDQGLDRVDIVSYNILLSYPDPDDPNIISLLKDGRAIFKSQKAEKILRPDDIHPGDKIVPPFNAFSPPGDVVSEKLFYVNYAREEDFFWLKNNKSVNFTDSIAIARYGKIYRGNKIKTAQDYGVKAVILYSDPYDYASPTDNSSYPNSWWLPGTGVQRGTIKNGDGDALTPYYPALDSAFRDDPDKTDSLPKIPAHPIGYDDARKLLDKLGGEEVPATWQGSLPGLTYKMGGSFSESGLEVKMHITTHNEMKRTYNVIGYINGTVEQDRYVVVGNHRDGWVYGALDPSSSTAAMLEASRAITSVMKSANWRPRRTLVFCNWGAEEHGIIGSFEFAEHFSKVLGQRTVAYLNADVLLQGTDYLRIRASPMLQPTVMRAAKKVPNPKKDEVAAGFKTVYDSWVHFYPSPDDPTKPKVRSIGSGSDYSSFQNVLGIPCLEPRYTYDSRKWKISSYPLYHTVYETFYLVNNIMDPGFKLSRAVTQVWAELIRDISDSLILPLDAKSFADYISTESQRILDAKEELMKQNNLTSDVDYFKGAIKLFQKEAEGFVEHSSKVNKMNPYAVREVNDKLMNLHRSFLDPQGLPGRRVFKNVLLAPSAFDSYSGAVFPSITDSLYRIETSEDADKWTKVKKNLSIVTYMLHTAAATLRESAEFSKV